MKKEIYRADTRGSANHGWLQARFSFSFADYHNPERTHFGMLRVLNDDIISPNSGFGTHPHDNMEIVTIPLTGELTHKDNTGKEEVIREDEIQVMSAGTGILHSEYNNSETEEINLLQSWIFPRAKGLEPRYDQKKFDRQDRKNKIHTVVGPEKDGDNLWLNQDVYYSLTDLDSGKTVEYSSKREGNGLYLFVIEGEIEIDGETLAKRDDGKQKEPKNKSGFFLNTD